MLPVKDLDVYIAAGVGFDDARRAVAELNEVPSRSISCFSSATAVRRSGGLTLRYRNEEFGERSFLIRPGVDPPGAARVHRVPAGNGTV